MFLEPEAAMVSAKTPAHEKEINYAFTDKQITKVLWEAARLKSTEPGGRPPLSGPGVLTSDNSVGCLIRFAEGVLKRAGDRKCEVGN